MRLRNSLSSAGMLLLEKVMLMWRPLCIIVRRRRFLHCVLVDDFLGGYLRASSNWFAKGTRRMEAEVDVSLLLPNPVKFVWVSNEVLTTKSKYRFDTDMGDLSPLALDGPNEGEEWVHCPVGVDERECSPSDEGKYAEFAKVVMYEVLLNEICFGI